MSPSLWPIATALPPVVATPPWAARIPGPKGMRRNGIPVIGESSDRSSFLALSGQLEPTSYILSCSAVRRACRASSAASFAASFPNPTPMT
jgi:hypothetical protein